MPRPRVKINQAGVRALLSDPGVRAELERRAAAVEAAAKASAPVASGQYRDSIRAQSDSSPIDGRARATVGATAPHALVVEARTGNLARALNAAGGA